MKIVFPEFDNPIIGGAITISGVEAVSAPSLAEGARMVALGGAQGMIAGIDYTSREVILAARDYIGLTGKTFSSSFVMDMPSGKRYVLADCATCKNPTSEQLFDIIVQTLKTARASLTEELRVAVLSFSTKRSGGTDASIDRAEEVISRVQAKFPKLLIDGEMQLDAAVNPAIGKRKAPGSPVAGRANVLICPDLNSGNILYKSMEQFGGAEAYGPILQGFKKPVSDLSRGSTVEDVVGVIKIMGRLMYE